MNKWIFSRRNNSNQTIKLSLWRLALTRTAGTVISLTNLATPIQAQEVVKVRFAWSFTPAGGALYFNICDDPKINVSQSTGGCAEINVLNEVVTNNKNRTRLVSDRLRDGTAYKACLVADNIGSSYSGRWIQCYDFVATNGQSITFSLNGLRYVGTP